MEGSSFSLNIPSQKLSNSYNEVAVELCRQPLEINLDF